MENVFKSVLAQIILQPANSESAYVLLTVSYFIPSEMLFARVSPESQPQKCQAPSAAPQEAERSCDKLSKSSETIRRLKRAFIFAPHTAKD